MDADKLMLLQEAILQAKEIIKNADAIVITAGAGMGVDSGCLLYTSPSPRDTERSRMPSSA